MGYLEEYYQAREFCLRTHKSDLDRINSLDGLMTDFDKFFYEYVYVVLASGFKGIIAARLTPKLIEVVDDYDAMFELFKNKRKLKAIQEVYAKKDSWQEFRATLKDVDSLTNLPFIGEVTKYHLARNIGLISCGKPDLHLCRWCEKHTGDGSPGAVAKLLKSIQDVTHEKLGTIDFSLWVWLSHYKGEEMPCCNGGYALR